KDIKIQTQVQKIQDLRRPASVLVNEISWQIVGQLPIKYRISFFREGSYKTLLCTEIVPSSWIYFKLKGGDDRVAHLNLWAEEKYAVDPQSLCHQSVSAQKGLKRAFYKVDALGYDGRIIRY